MLSSERVVAALLGLAILAAVGFTVVYATSAQVQIAAALLAFAFTVLAAAMVVYERRLMARREYIEDRGSLPSGTDKVEAAVAAFADGAREVGGSRRGLMVLFAGALAALGAAAVFPLRSLAMRGIGPRDVAATNWRRGQRLMLEDGRPLHVADLVMNSIVTVFPEGHVGPSFTDAMANDATVVVRVPAEELRLPEGRTGWAPDGLVAYSKICTHAGCPVALYRAAARQLFCPCHQSTFDVLTGGARIFGPAARALPQLPLAIAADGTLVAADGYAEPIGPDYWERA